MTKCTNAPGSYREAIPEDVRLRLWVQSGGRCAICNDVVYRDGLTLTVGNFADLAHIIAYSEDGPRGNENSSNLTISYDNLMLLCKTHHKLIDDNPGEWPIDKLSKTKKVHEERIENLTAITSDLKTHVITVQSNIGENSTSISQHEVREAIVKFGRYPTTEHPYNINLGAIHGRGDETFYKEKASEISASLSAFLRPFDRNNEKAHISIFALTLMPLLVHFGKELGDKYPIQLYQHHREPYSGWFWPEATEYEEYIINKPDQNNIDKSSDVFLKISLSDHIAADKCEQLIGKNPNIYEITILQPHTGFLINSKQLAEFHSVYRSLLNDIQFLHGVKATIHLLIAAPCPIAIQCGLSLLQRKELHMIAYDYERDLGGFIKALQIT